MSFWHGRPDRAAHRSGCWASCSCCDRRTSRCSGRDGCCSTSAALCAIAGLAAMFTISAIGNVRALYREEPLGGRA